jgi:pyridoxine 4-dehydrogenase
MDISSARKGVRESGTFAIGGDLVVRRLGYGSMQLTGPGRWGPPADPAAAVAVLREAVELGVNLIDTADEYGPHLSEELIHDALHPYPEDLVIATKGGYVRPGPGRWVPLGRPAYLRQSVELSLRRLGLERIDLYQLHRVDPLVPVEDSIGELRELQAEGKIRHIGMSEVGPAELERARAIAPIVSVQNRFNLIDRSSEPVVDYAEAHGMAFIPWFPIATGALADAGLLGPDAASAPGTPAQLALAWLLHRSPAILPIPGTASIGHLRENLAAGSVALDAEIVGRLDTLAPTTSTTSATSATSAGQETT